MTRDSALCAVQKKIRKIEEVDRPVGTVLLHVFRSFKRTEIENVWKY